MLNTGETFDLTDSECFLTKKRFGVDSFLRYFYCFILCCSVDWLVSKVKDRSRIDINLEMVYHLRFNYYYLNIINIGNDIITPFCGQSENNICL